MPVHVLEIFDKAEEEDLFCVYICRLSMSQEEEEEEEEEEEKKGS